MALDGFDGKQDDRSSPIEGRDRQVTWLVAAANAKGLSKRRARSEAVVPGPSSAFPSRAELIDRRVWSASAGDRHDEKWTRAARLEWELVRCRFLEGMLKSMSDQQEESEGE